MKVQEQFIASIAATNQVPAAKEVALRPAVRQAVSTANKVVVSSQAVNVAPPVGGEQRDVTFRRDGNGRVYYVVSDAQSGQEIQELPAAAVRSVGQGIDELLKQEEAKARPHVNVKA
jgi:hypothetical protein